MPSPLLRWFVVLIMGLVAPGAFGQRRCAVRIDTAAIVSGRNFEEFMALLQTEAFALVSRKQDLPPFIQQQMACLTADGFALANPGEDYNCCCTTSSALPPRQLQFAAKSARAYVLAYHIGHGKVAPTYLVVFRHGADGRVDLWTGYGSGQVQSVADLVAFCRGQKAIGYPYLRYAIDF